MKTLFRHIKNNDGSIINIALSMLLLMSSMGISATTTTTDDVKIATNYKYDRVAFFDAFSGIQYGLTKIENDLKANTPVLPSTSSPTNLTYKVPANFSFSLSPITLNATNRYTISANGAGPKDTTAAIEVKFKRKPAIGYGAYGDDLVDMKSNSAIYSYDSRVTPSPNPANYPANSTGEGDVGSNNEVNINSTYVDGDVALGEEGGSDAIIVSNGSPTITGDNGVEVGRVDPDPLGVVGGDYASKFTAYSASNDNGTTSSTTGSSIVANKINLSNGYNLTLFGKLGGANYYLESIDLANSATLNVNATAGPVNIFLTGKLDAKNGSSINFTDKPTDFSIFSNSTADITLFNSGDFKGLVYAPLATVEIKNSGYFYGAIWGETVDIKASGRVFYDTALKDTNPLDDLNVLSWRQLW